MPELPEVETTRKGLEPYIVGQTIKEILVHFPKLRWPIPNNLGQFKNQTCSAVLRRGKYLIFVIEKQYLLIHLGMSGYLQLVSNKAPLKKHDHFEILFNNQMALRLNDARRFGAVLLCNDLNNHFLLKNLGPEPLTRAFNSNYLLNRLRNCRKAIKLAIMDSQFVVGVGNIYANESLYLAKINPNRNSSELTITEIKNLTKAIKQVLQKAIKAGGTTLKDFQNIEGKPGYFAQRLQIYGKNQEKCPHCQTHFQSSRLGQRITLWCPKCQI